MTDVQAFGGEYRVLYVENFKDKYEGTAEIRQTVSARISDEKIKPSTINGLRTASSASLCSICIRGLCGWISFSKP
ncbi:MAG: hypothetical protein LRY51_12710 [Geovibrio sp.]|nr:hypothetical protein [Geovibrio sp.]